MSAFDENTEEKGQGVEGGVYPPDAPDGTKILGTPTDPPTPSIYRKKNFSKKKLSKAHSGISPSAGKNNPMYGKPAPTKGKKANIDSRTLRERNKTISQSNKEVFKNIKKNLYGPIVDKDGNVIDENILPLIDLIYVAPTTHIGVNAHRIKKAFIHAIRLKGDLPQALKLAGYKERYITTMASKVIRSKTWRELIDFFFPDINLFEHEKELLAHPDWRAKNAALERINKMKGNFVQKVELSIKEDSDISQLSDEQLDHILKTHPHILEADVVDDAKDASDTSQVMENE